MGLAAAVVGAGVVGAVGSVVAGQEQAGAAKKSANTQLAMYNQTRADLLPYMNAGAGALPTINTMLTNPGAALPLLRNYPGYQWAFDQGQQAVDRSAASRGMLLSGGQLKDQTSYGQGMADQLFSNYFGQLYQTAQLGENAAAMTGQQGTYAAAGAGQAYQQAGAANAAGTMGATNALFGSGGAFQSAVQGGLLSGVFSSPSAAAGLAPDISSALSDRRAKTDIRRVGTLDSGLPVYTYRIKGSALPQMGVMSDEVRRVDPHAVRRGRDGFDRVDYRRVAMLPAMREAA